MVYDERYSSIVGKKQVPNFSQSLKRMSMGAIICMRNIYKLIFC